MKWTNVEHLHSRQLSTPFLLLLVWSPQKNVHVSVRSSIFLSPEWPAWYTDIVTKSVVITTCMRSDILVRQHLKIKYYMFTGLIRLRLIPVHTIRDKRSKVCPEYGRDRILFSLEGFFGGGKIGRTKLLLYWIKLLHFCLNNC